MASNSLFTTLGQSFDNLDLFFALGIENQNDEYKKSFTQDLIAKVVEVSLNRLAEEFPESDDYLMELSQKADVKEEDILDHLVKKYPKLENFLMEESKGIKKFLIMDQIGRFENTVKASEEYLEDREYILTLLLNLKSSIETNSPDLDTLVKLFNKYKVEYKLQ